MSQHLIGIVGSGGRINGVVKNVMNINPDIVVSAIHDVDPAAARACRKRLGPDIVLCKSYEELLARPEISWIFIGSWNAAHREQAEQAFRVGKHVFLEKPIATTIPDCFAVLRAWKKSGKQLSVGFTLRYSPHYRKIRELIDAGEIGELISMEFNETLEFNHGGYMQGDWRRHTRLSGGFLLEKCCHDMDLANWMTGSRALKVASFGGNDFFIPKNKKIQEEIGPGPQGYPAYLSFQPLMKSPIRQKRQKNPFTCRKDIVDNQVAILEYENGVRATFHTNCNAGIPERRMLLLGTRGAIRAELIAGTIELQRIGFDEPRRVLDAGVNGSHGGGDEVLAQSVAAEITRGAEPFTSTLDGLTSAVTVLAIDQSMREGRILSLAEHWRKVDQMKRS